MHQGLSILQEVVCVFLWCFVQICLQRVFTTVLSLGSLFGWDGFFSKEFIAVARTGAQRVRQEFPHTVLSEAMKDSLKGVAEFHRVPSKDFTTRFWQVCAVVRTRSPFAVIGLFHQLAR